MPKDQPETFELIHLLLMDNEPKNEFLKFENRFQSFIDQMPSYLHSVGKDGFFPSLIFGIFATLFNTELSSQLKIEKIYFRFDNYRTLKLVVLKESKPVYIVVSDESDNLEFSNKDLESLKLKPDSQSRYKEVLVRKQGDQEDIPIKVSVREGLSFKQIDGDSETKSFIEISDTETSGKRESDKFESLIRSLASRSSRIVEDKLKNLLRGAINIYKKYESYIEKNPNARESSDHGFLAGFLINFKYRFNLKLYLELFAGKGYADIVLLVRGEQRKTDSVPVIIELKTGEHTAESALEQAKSYAQGFSPIAMRIITTSYEVVCVGLNFCAIATNNQLKTKVEYTFTRSKDFFMENALKIADKQKAGTEIREGIERLYHAIVSTNGGDNTHYLSRFILGEEILSPNTFSDQELEKYVFIYKENVEILEQARSSGQTERRAKQEAKKGLSKLTGLDKSPTVTSLIFTVADKVFVLNIAESSYNILDALKIPIDEIRKTNSVKIYEVNCQLQGIPTKSNPFSEYCKKVVVKTYNSLNEYKEGKVFEGEFKQMADNTSIESALASAVDLEKAGSREYTKVFHELSISLRKINNDSKFLTNVLITSEALFQALLHGLFYGYNNLKETDFKVITEFQSGGGKQVDIMLVVERIDREQNKKYVPVGIELKYATQRNKQEKIKKAKVQLGEYLKGALYKMITDSDEIRMIYVIFYEGASDEEPLIEVSKDYEEVIGHSSKQMPQASKRGPPSPQIQEPAAESKKAKSSTR